MPTLTEESIYRISFHVLRAAGADDGNASTVARHLADANLAGHDSHGFIRVSQYVRDIREKDLDPKAQPEVAREAGATAQVDGHSTFGQVVATFSTKLAVQKARQYGIGLVTMFDMGHTGRVGTYPEMAAKQGMAAIMCYGTVGDHSEASMAPFGGRERRLSTNPISMGFPSGGSPVFLDFATTMAAEGKLRVYRNKGQPLPHEWVLTKDGVPTRDPNAYYDGGSILPVGGMEGGHKGYALAFMVALFGGLMGSAGSTDGRGRGKGASIIVIDVGAMAPGDAVRDQVDEVVRLVTSSPPVEGSSGVLYPGEVEARSRQERLANGVPIEQATWDPVEALIKEFSLEGELKDILEVAER